MFGMVLLIDLGDVVGMGGFLVQKDIKLLVFLNNMGITAPHRYVTVDSICRLNGWAPEEVQMALTHLIDDEHVSEVSLYNHKRFYVTPKGIIKAASGFS
jgi:hypothetical protein